MPMSTWRFMVKAGVWFSTVTEFLSGKFCCPGETTGATCTQPVWRYGLVHYDHLDYPTVLALRSKVKRVVVGLGVGAHFKRWGYAVDQIHEADWNDIVKESPEVDIHVVPARHFSGHTLTRNPSLWVGFALDGSNVRALKAAAGAKKNIPMNARTMGWVALAAALAPKSIWRQMVQDDR